MNSYTPEVGKFISAISALIKKHDHLSEVDIIGGLRISAAMMEAHVTGGRIHVHIVNIVPDDNDEGIDPADAWKYDH